MTTSGSITGDKPGLPDPDHSSVVIAIALAVATRQSSAAPIMRDCRFPPASGLANAAANTPGFHNSALRAEFCHRNLNNLKPSLDDRKSELASHQHEAPDRDQKHDDDMQG